ncbi:hypothetical protein N9H60_03020 [Flavimaricola sp.]|nr:hypothetical protein [Flavimaricola sp.]MDA9020131.1 hypothetical protein [Flavimaricola sp.]
MSRNAVKHGVTASLNATDVDAWVDVITFRGRLGPHNSHEATALAEAEVRIRAAHNHWRRVLTEAAKEFEDTEDRKQLEAMRVLLRGLIDPTGPPVDREGMRLLKAIARSVDRSNKGSSKELRLASRYLSEAFSARARRFEDWVACLGAFSRNEEISTKG